MVDRVLAYMDAVIVRFFPWFIIIGVSFVGTGILWAMFLSSGWFAWLLTGLGFFLCLPVWLQFIWNETGTDS